MSRRHPVKYDANQGDLVKAWKGVGAKVIDLARFGAPFDVAILFRGAVYLADVKSTDGTLTDNQRALVEDGWPLVFPRTTDEALRCIGAIA